MHIALSHKDSKTQSALRQARGVMVTIGRVDKVHSMTQLAERIKPRLDFPQELGAPDERMDVLVCALRILQSAQLISLHRKNGYARITRKGLHADRSMPPSRRPGRRGWQSAAA